MRHFSLVVLPGLWLATSLPAQPAAGRLTPRDAFNLETPSDPRISPDGRRLVYVRQAADLMTDHWKTGLWIVNADGSDHRPLTSGKGSASSPRWSPDGTRVAYISDESGSPQIYVRWMESGATAMVGSLEQAPSNLAWSPDGRYLAYTALVLEPPAKVVDLPTAPDGAKWADPPLVVDRMVYRFDGVGYLKKGFQHLFVIPAEGGTPRRLSSGPYHHGGSSMSAAGEPAWSPDGKSILISANRRADWELEGNDTEVYEVSVADGSLRAVTRRHGPDNAPVPSPDGRLVAYLGFDDRYQGYQVTELHVANRDGSGARVLTASLDRDVGGAQWAADGRGLYFLYDDKGHTRIGFVTLEGRVRSIVGAVGNQASAYASGDFSVSPGGTIAFTTVTADRPPEVAVLPPGATVPTIVTSINADLLAGKAIGAVEELWLKSSKDRRDIQAWILKPPGFDPSRKYPLILEIHGGPFANYGDRFDFEKQVLAASGYVVLYVNPRGSTSYGQGFGNLIHHAYPGDDFYDLDSAVDAVLAKGYVDPAELYVTGGSGGGVLTAWMIGRSTRYRAAAVLYPVINWASFVLTSDFPAEGVKYWFPAAPWDSVQHYWSRSLLSVVKNVKTPTMVMTGEADYRTPMSESEQYYEALKLLGVEAVLVRFPEEPHGIRRRPSHWMAKVAHLEGWFARHRPAMP